MPTRQPDSVARLAAPSQPTQTSAKKSSPAGAGLYEDVLATFAVETNPGSTQQDTRRRRRRGDGIDDGIRGLDSTIPDGHRLRLVPSALNGLAGQMDDGIDTLCNDLGHTGPVDRRLDPEGSRGPLGGSRHCDDQPSFRQHWNQPRAHKSARSTHQNTHTNTWSKVIQDINPPAMKGLLLLQLGTPDDPSPPAVRRYLREFLSDPMVLDINPVGRWALLN